MDNYHNQLTKRKVIGKMPSRVWVAIFISFAERFCFYGITAPFQNYLQNSPGSRPSGALGLGQATATAISESFSAYTKFAPLFGAIVADNWLGCYNTLLISACVYMLGAITLVVTSIPSMSQSINLGGFIAGSLLLGIGVGGFRGSMPTFVGDQYIEPENSSWRLNDGVVAVVDRDLAIRHIFSVAYWAINIGCLSSLATTMLERYVGFWVAFLLPLCLLCVGSCVLVLASPIFTKRTPKGNPLPKAARVLWCAARQGFNMDKAKASSQNPTHGENRPWTDEYVEELKTGLMACRVFLAFIILWFCLGQANNNLISQAGQMQTNNMPNDMLPLTVTSGTILIIMPIFGKFLYPWIDRKGIPFGPITRITVGFLLTALSIAYAAGLQSFIYRSGPCYDRPLQCFVNGTKGVPNTVSVARQIPIFIIQAISDVFCFVTGAEYAYKRAPKTMKNVIQSIFMCTGAFGSILAIAISPAAHDPYLVILYTSAALAMFVTAVLFWLAFRKDDNKEQENASET